jgi:DNA repair protein RecO
MFSIYTREMGLVRTMAQGVRFHKSKLRFSMQDFSYIKVDLVRGRDLWRVTTAKSITSFPFARTNKDSLLLIARISKLLERLCTGEQPNKKIFDDFIQVLYLLDDTNITSSSREALELYLVLRIMNTLGYIGDSLLLKQYLTIPFNEICIESLLKEKQSIIAYINKALNESQL